MSKIDNGGNAFPSTELNHDGTPYCFNEGMTLRQYAAIKLKVPDSGSDWLDDLIRESLRNDFAAKVIQGLCTRSNIDIQNVEYRTAIAYEQAEAMIKAQKGEL